MIKKSHTYLLYGKLKGAFGNYTIQTPEFTELFNFDIYNDGLDDMLMFKTKELEEKLKFYPIYGLTKNITQNFMRKVIFEILKSIDTFDIIDIVPKKYKKKRDLLDIVDALYNIHMPKNEEKKLKARETLVYEEFLKVQTALLYIKGETKREKGIAFSSKVETSEVLDKLPFELTGAQKRTLEELEFDLEKELVTERLIQGDVGSGKTIVTILAAYKAVKSGYQVAVMVPTAILADQHLESFRQILEEYGMNIQILKSGMKKKEKENILQGVTDRKNRHSYRYTCNTRRKCCI